MYCNFYMDIKKKKNYLHHHHSKLTHHHCNADLTYDARRSMALLIDLLAILKKNLNLKKNFVEFSNVHNFDRSSNATQSNLVYKNV